MQSTADINTTITTKTAKKTNFGRSLTNNKRTTKANTNSKFTIEHDTRQRRQSISIISKLIRSKESKEDKVPLAPTKNTTITTKKPKDNDITYYEDKRGDVVKDPEHLINRCNRSGVFAF